MEFSFPRYLAAKKPIDDRALNQHVWDTMAGNLRPAVPDAPVRVLEMGCGIGAMLERLMERGLFDVNRFLYTGIDSNPDNIHYARERFSQPSPFSLMPSSFTFLVADLFALPDTLPTNAFDLLIAHAFLDLVNVPRALPFLFSYLRPGGIFYFTLNFDGQTIFQPDSPLDSQIISCYHRTMDERITDGYSAGDSHTGRHIFGHLKQAGAEILAAGSSDWVVIPGRNGYPGDESYFLKHILHFFAQSLTERSEINAEQLSTWLAARHAQIEQGELIYIAHQVDVAGKIE
ncbi:MAG TPA: methyltransferase domain-containing protein [Anaerolineales bacterium]|nr:methyltransferase domain-containing protein [Anaerolineales bacterium]